MNAKPVQVKIFVLPGGIMPRRGNDDEDNAGFDVTARGVVSRQFVAERPYERELIFDFKKSPECALTDSTPLAGNSYIVLPGKGNTLRMTIHAMLYFGCGFVLDMPRGMYALVVSRGSTIAKGLRVNNADSPVDRGFCGEPVMAIHNFSSWFVEIGPEDLTLGQLIFPGHHQVELIQVSSFGELEGKPRGNGNHGSTDVKKK